MALRGLWGSFFSRSHGGNAMRRIRGIFSRIALVASPPVPAVEPDFTLQRLATPLVGFVRACKEHAVPIFFRDCTT